MLDNQNIKKLLTLSDRELRAKISDAAIAAGADKYYTALALADMGKIRNMLTSLSTEQINSMISKLDPTVIDELKKRIDK